VVVSTAKQAAPIVTPSSALAAVGNSANLIGMRGNTSKAIQAIFLTEAVSACGIQCQATPRRWTARQAPRAPYALCALDGTGFTGQFLPCRRHGDRVCNGPNCVLLKLSGVNEVDRAFKSAEPVRRMYAISLSECQIEDGAKPAV
jgi:hypothetical protein